MLRQSPTLFDTQSFVLRNLLVERNLALQMAPYMISGVANYLYPIFGAGALTGRASRSEGRTFGELICDLAGDT